MNEKRIGFLVTGILVLCLILIARLAQLQLINGEVYRNRATNIRLKRVLIPGQRGSIVDRNGIELAREDAVWELCMNYWIFIEPDNILQRLEYLSISKSGLSKTEFSQLTEILQKIADFRNQRSIPKSQRFFDSWQDRQHPLIRKELNLTLNRLADLLGVDVNKFIEKIELLEAEINTLINEKSDRITDRYLKIVRLGSSAGYWFDLARDERRHKKPENYRLQDNPLVLLDEIEGDSLETIQEVEWLFPGISGKPKHKRTYPLGETACHLIGYLREVERIGFTPEPGKEFNIMDSPYFKREMESAIEDITEDFILRHFRDTAEFGKRFKRDVYKIQRGVSGLERYLNDKLSGDYGISVLEKDVSERSKKVLDEVPPQAAKPVALTIDAELQAKTEAILKDYFDNGNPNGCAGAGVVMNIYSGEILVLASYPTFDLNKLMSNAKEDKKYVTQLFADEFPGKPVFNRSLHATVPPGSVFKIVTGIAAAEEGILPGPEFWDPKDFGTKWDVAERLKQRGFTDHVARGKINLAKAIEVSCNPFFHEQAYKLGYERLWHWANKFGFGEKTGASLPEFEPWRKNNRGETYNWLYPLKPATKLESALNGIGQGALRVTPLQVCRFMCAVANNGIMPTPAILKEELGTLPVKKIKASENCWRSVHKGMQNVVFGSQGTARTISDLRACKAAGKTGTAQTSRKLDGKELNFGWFSGYAPYDNPVLAFAVYIEDTFDSGGNSAGKAAGKILQAFAASPEFKSLFK